MLNICVLVYLIIFLLSPFQVFCKSLLDSEVKKLIVGQFEENDVDMLLKYTSNINIDKYLDNFKQIKLDNIDLTNQKFRIIVYNEDDVLSKISGSYELLKNIPISKHHIKIGSIIDVSDLIHVKLGQSKLKKEYLCKDIDIVGKQASHDIFANKFFTINDIRNPYLVKTKDIVDILYNSGSISLKVSGTALASGSMDDIIKVKNNSSGKILIAKVIASNTVEISQ
ncbi:flagellar basal body P-ring formation chaperone FlgA [Rickettsia endosymbiont of Cardiosporidium cionae]|uniref:flagellar basal body P-ring formation chaperone FlgA n=1 Tax=Rickettsia endosymbiont of Cardiosporidium cionae TaxID=2777155 RepID=UPI001895E0DE|nr:flagellar basal body P-ring formation chaperone FlgA [Rickettsia endosymbiont of Cardiosporidium cionae]KAF8818207.1 hypothetical protein IHI24_000662 [Rickettsia endosymbiont of Cardiosporidium cionae]